MYQVRSRFEGESTFELIPEESERMRVFKEFLKLLKVLHHHCMCVEFFYFSGRRESRGGESSRRQREKGKRKGEEQRQERQVKWSLIISCKKVKKTQAVSIKIGKPLTNLICTCSLLCHLVKGFIKF